MTICQVLHQEVNQLKRRRVIEKNTRVAIRLQKNHPTIKRTKAIEKYRSAQLSLLKAKIRIIRERISV